MRLFNRYYAPRLLFLLLVECAVIFLIAIAAAAIRLRFDNGYVIYYDPMFIKTCVVTLGFMLTFYYFGLYTQEMYHLSINMFMRLIQAVMVATIILIGTFYIIPPLRTWRGILLIITILLPPTIVVWRYIFSKLLRYELPGKRVLIIGSGELAKKIGQEIFTKTGQGFKLIGFIDDDPAKLGVSVVNPGVIGGYGDISSVVDTSNIDMIIIALPDRRAKLPMLSLLDCKLKGITIEEGATFNERLDGKIPLDYLKPSWMVFSNGFKSLRSRKIIKRIFDIVVASVCVVFAAPVMLLTALIIKLESRGPVIFKQLRIGEQGKPFLIYKFRSMRQDAENASGPIWAGTNDARVTRVGKIIRRIRLDELPQLYNVLKGDMSFVGPRPERPFFVKRLKEQIPYYEMRTVVKPGITGWAQIKYPYGASVEDAMEKLQYDIYYIKNMSPLLDAMIFFWTIRAVLTGRGAR